MGENYSSDNLFFMHQFPLNSLLYLQLSANLRTLEFYVWLGTIYKQFYVVFIAKLNFL